MKPLKWNLATMVRLVNRVEKYGVLYWRPTPQGFRFHARRRRKIQRYAGTYFTGDLAKASQALREDYAKKIMGQLNEVSPLMELYRRKGG